MKKTFNFKKELSMAETVSSITSISLDTTFNEGVNCIEGSFLIEGNYKSHELSLNKKDFRFELPFQEILENLKESTANLEVVDFTYDLNDSTLGIDIEYNVDYEENEIADEFDEEEFERFLEDHEVDIVDFQNEMEEAKEERIAEENTKETAIIEEIEEVADEEEKHDEEIEEIEEERKEEPECAPIEEEQTESPEKREVTIIPTSEEEGGGDATSVILNNIDKQEKYITYHVYLCESDDTFESIAEKFKTTKEEIREYNEIDDIEYGRKLIIPVKDE